MESKLIYFAARLMLFFLRRIPRLAVHLILDLLGAITYYFDKPHRHVANVNLRIAFPELGSHERRRIALRSFQITAHNLLEVSRLATLTAGNISSLVEYDEVRGLNNFEAARSRGKPILYLTGHFSAWELLPAAHAIYGHPLSFVTRPLDNSRLERYLLKIRESSGNRVISKKNSVRQILEILKASGSVGILLDQNTDPREGIFVPFFDLPACTSTSIARFALRTDATVLPGYLTPIRKGRYRIKFLPPLELIRTGDWARDVEANTRRYNLVLAEIIREQPESWLWGHKRWRYQPPGSPGDIYRMSEASLLTYLSEKQAHRNEEISHVHRSSRNMAGKAG